MADDPHAAIIGIYQITLYGILVTEDSFLKGLRRCERTSLGHRVASAVIPDKVPTELADQIYDEVGEHTRRIVEEKWASCSTRDERLHKFAVEAEFPGTAKEASIRFLDRTINATSVALSTAINTATPIDSNNPITYYIHLSTAEKHPEPKEFAGQATSFHPVFPNQQGVFWGNAKSFVVGKQENEQKSPEITTDMLMYLEDPHDLPTSHSDPHTHRLVQLGGIKEAIKNWDGELIKNLVNFMELEVVPFDAGMPFEPEILQYQRVHE
ncbi:unnamed protein product [Cercospora beticola]|nr:unnamed protein product [Cercospora beticola]